MTESMKKVPELTSYVRQMIKISLLTMSSFILALNLRFTKQLEKVCTELNSGYLLALHHSGIVLVHQTCPEHGLLSYEAHYVGSITKTFKDVSIQTRVVIVCIAYNLNPIPVCKQIWLDHSFACSIIWELKLSFQQKWFTKSNPVRSAAMKRVKDGLK